MGYLYTRNSLAHWSYQVALRNRPRKLNVVQALDESSAISIREVLLFGCIGR